MHITLQQLDALRERAFDAASRAYAPYSGFHVGAALLASDGNIYLGCNVENASYGLTNCAERSAVFAAIQSVVGDRKNLIHAMVIVNHKRTPMPPCGACRQVLLEFGSNGVISFQGIDGEKTMKIIDLLPEAFML